MKLFTTLVVAAFAPLALSGIYVCKSQALSSRTDCEVKPDCPGNCKIYTWDRGYCGIGDCYSKSAWSGDVARVDVVERHCTGTYGCACDRGDEVNSYHYLGKVDQCSSSPLIDSDPITPIYDEDLEPGEGILPTPAP